LVLALVRDRDIVRRVIPTKQSHVRFNRDRDRFQLAELGARTVEFVRGTKGLLAVTSIVMLACSAIAGCSWTTAHSSSPSRPPNVPADPACRDWFRLTDDVRLSYAKWQLFTLRSDDGVAPANQPTATQVSDFRVEMDAECHQDSLDVASLKAVAHDVYTAAYGSGKYRSP
jgi:hypothetical protein